MDNRKRWAQDTEWWQTKQNKTQKIKMTSNTHPIKTPEVLAKGNQFLFLIRHPACHPYPSPVKVLYVIEGRKHLCKMEKIHWHLKNGYFVTINQCGITSVECLLRSFNLWADNLVCVADSSAAELCPENHCIGHKP